MFLALWFLGAEPLVGFLEVGKKHVFQSGVVFCSSGAGGGSSGGGGSSNSSSSSSSSSSSYYSVCLLCSVFCLLFHLICRFCCGGFSVWLIYSVFCAIVWFYLGVV